MRSCAFMTVILIYPPNQFVETKSRQVCMDIYPPLGLLYLASVLEKNGISVKVLDAVAPFASLRTMNDIVTMVEKENVSIVGISATTPQIRGATQLATKLREEFGRNITIGLGGIHLTSDPGFIDRFPIFDFGVIGEGEITFLELVEQIRGGNKVNGVYQGKRPTNLDEIPFPARHLINKYDYFERGQEHATISTSRGCPFNCIFCNVPISKGRKVRRRSPKNVVDEMEEIVDEYGGRFYFVDDDMTVNRKHTLQLCSEIVARKMDVEWGCQTRVDLVNRSLLEAMYKAGCRSIAFGVESGCERIRNSVIRKNVTNEQIFKAFRLCKEITISTTCYLMLGFPTETLDDCYQTVNIATKINPDIVGVHLTEIMPGTDIFRYAVDEGIVPNDIFDKYARGETDLIGNWPIYIPKGLSLNDLTTARKNAYRRFYFRPRYVFQRFAQDLSSFYRLKRDMYLAWQLFRHGATPYSLDRMTSNHDKNV